MLRLGWEVSFSLGTPHRVAPHKRLPDKAARLLLPTCSLLNTTRLAVCRCGQPQEQRSESGGWGGVGAHPDPRVGWPTIPSPFLGSAPAPSDTTALAEATGATQESLTASGREAAYVPVQRGDVFVTGDIVAPLPDTVPQHQLRGAAVAVFIQVPYPGGRVSGPAQGTHPALSARSQSKECPPPLVARLALLAFITLLKTKQNKTQWFSFQL